MPALAEFLKDTAKESLTKLVQPAGLIPGTLLVLLNVGLILPRARSEKVGIATDFAGLDDAWQVVIGASLVLLVGFLLLSASSAILDTLAGRTWRLSVLSSLLRWVRDRRRSAVLDRIDRVHLNGPGADIERLSELLWRNRSRQAPLDRSSAPTALGDVLFAFDKGITERYGLGLAALWEPLRASVKSDDAAITAVAESKATLDLMANITFALVLFIAEAVVVYSLFDDPRSVLLALAGLPVAYLAYRVTVAKTVSWCDAIDTTVALHAHELLERLGIRKAKSGADRRALLTRATAFMLRDATDDALFGPASAQTPAITASPHLSIEAHEHEERSSGAAMQSKSIAYELWVTQAKDTNAYTTAGFFFFEDPRLPRIREVPTVDPATIVPTLVEAVDEGGSDSLRFEVTATAGVVTRISFELEAERLEVTPAGLELTVVRELADGTRLLKIENPGAPVDGAQVQIFHTEDGATHTLEPAELPSPLPTGTHRAKYRLRKRE